MALILNIETTGHICSASVGKNGSLLALQELSEPGSHARQLTVLIENLLQEIKTEPAGLDAVAISQGPGSYTGLRIGTSVAKGICFGAGLPLIAIDSLKSLAALVHTKEAAIPAGAWLCPMTDARRMEVYCAFYDTSLQEKKAVGAEVISENSFDDILSSRDVLFFGTGSDKCKEIIKSSHAHFLDGIVPSSAGMCALSEQVFRAKTFADVAYFEPFYLKPFIAIPSKQKGLRSKEQERK